MNKKRTRKINSSLQVNKFNFVKKNMINASLCIPALFFFIIPLPFFTGVVFLDVCDTGGLPPEGVVEVGLEAAGLAVVEEDFGVAGFAVVRKLLLVVGGRAEPGAG